MQVQGRGDFVVVKRIGLGAILAACLFGCGSSKPTATATDGGAMADTTDATATIGPTVWDVPLAAGAPWPKFRRDARQTGRSSASHAPSGNAPLWSFKTGKGIFSSPIVSADETVYIGSADRHFYALNKDGSKRWDFATGEIIDSSGLLDDKGLIYIPSGDGHLYARKAATGDEVWTFAADDPKTTGGLINWFEGNVAMAPNGNLLVPNDNFWVYAIDRSSGKALWHATRSDQTWSLPALDVAKGLFVQGNNQLVKALGNNVFAFYADGKPAWSASTPGTIAASPLLTSGGIAVLGGFDGIAHAWDIASGKEVWSFATRDHIYASAAELSDGTVILPSTDGTVYALDPATGALKWAFDTLEPIRSSPAVDSEDRIYFGSGDGRLYVINPNGTLRFSLRLIDADRNDLNASPALGHDAIYLGGEDGRVFGVPYDYCLRPSEAKNAACTLGPNEVLPNDGVLLLQTTRFGSPLLQPTATIDANEALAFSLFVRKGGDTVLAVLDSTTLKVDSVPPSAVQVRVSGDRRFFTLVPQPMFAGGVDGKVQLHIQGKWLSDPQRDGLKTTGGKVGGPIDVVLTYTLATGGPTALPLPIAATPAAAGGVWAMYRLAAPLPTILPSYNQIGFDSLHWLVGLVHGDGKQAVGWVVGALPQEAAPGIVVDPQSKAQFPVTLTLKDGAVTLQNQGGLALEMMNASLSFTDFRVNARLDAKGSAPAGAVLTVTSKCSDIQLYGVFLKMLGFCNPDTDLLVAFGAVLLEPLGSGTVTPPAGVGAATFVRTATEVKVTLAGGQLPNNAHRLGILLEDSATGQPLALSYGPLTTQHADADGKVDAVMLDISKAKLPIAVQAWLLVDAQPVAQATSL